jgi:glycine dehydrogenase
VGSNPEQIDNLSQLVGFKNANDLIDHAIPKSVRGTSDLNVPILKRVPEIGMTEEHAMKNLEQISSYNQANITSMIGMGYYDTITPLVLKRNIIENPNWYTPYTPYQAEIAQGRLESLINYQTMISSLTGLPYANASLLDEASAAAEAFAISYGSRITTNGKVDGSASIYLIDPGVHPQTINVIRGRASCFKDVEVLVTNPFEHNYKQYPVFGLLLQYPNTFGHVYEADKVRQLFTQIRQNSSGATQPIIAMATDLLALTLLTPPGELGADIALGNSQRFGVPLGCGGPHAAFFATTATLLRRMPGRIIGFTKDSQSNDRVFRLTLQTREQHIRRSKATSNICTAQALLANLATSYAVYHGPTGLKKIARHVHSMTKHLYELHTFVQKYMCTPITIAITNQWFFDTLEFKITPNSINTCAPTSVEIIDLVSKNAGINIRYIDHERFSISTDETTDLQIILKLVSTINKIPQDLIHKIINNMLMETGQIVTDQLQVAPGSVRVSPILTQELFNQHHTETAMMRYLHKLEAKDLGLNNSMIPLGSCTMKLNAAAEMYPITWKQINHIHPYAPIQQMDGYSKITQDLRQWLADITGFADVSFQPNSGATGEYAGLRVIQAYHQGNGALDRNVCLIPDSAHGTNPASAAMAGFEIIIIKSDKMGNVDLEHLKEMVKKYKDRLSAMMITYPSTYGVFEEEIKEICDLVHQNGGQVYMDGANMNAQVAITSPGSIGADVCHLNLHKTFCIPHGGGGPGMGPIAVAQHLVEFLPRDPLISGQDGTRQQNKNILPITGARWSSASILPIVYQYISMMGSYGLLHATKTAIVNANYMAMRLKHHYKILYSNNNGLCAHEFIIDLREFLESAGITAIDVGKRLQDYGFHAPTLSWPVPNTIMIEPTESESQVEMDRYCDALISIRGEIELLVKNPTMSRTNNILKNSPHTVKMVSSNEWKYQYTREQAAFPLPWLKEHKHWPTVGRVDEIHGDRHLITNWIQYEESKLEGKK